MHKKKEGHIEVLRPMHPSRIQLRDVIAKDLNITRAQMAEKLNWQVRTVDYHLGLLLDKGVIEKNIEGFKVLDYSTEEKHYIYPATKKAADKKAAEYKSKVNERLRRKSEGFIQKSLWIKPHWWKVLQELITKLEQGEKNA